MNLCFQVSASCTMIMIVSDHPLVWLIISGVVFSLHWLIIQWNLDITVTIGTVLPGCYTEVTCLCSDPVMYWGNLGLSLLTGIDQRSGLYRWPLTQVPLHVHTCPYRCVCFVLLGITCSPVSLNSPVRDGSDWTWQECLLECVDVTFLEHTMLSIVTRWIIEQCLILLLCSRKFNRPWNLLFPIVIKNVVVL